MIIYLNFWRWVTLVWARPASCINTRMAYSIQNFRPPLVLIFAKNEWYARRIFLILNLIHWIKKKISISNADKKLYNSKGRNFRVHMQLWDTSGQERYERISLCNLNDFLESFLSFRAKVSKSHNGFLSWRSWIFVDFRSDEWAVISWDCLLDGSTKGKEKYNLIDKIDKQFLQLNK